MLSNEHYMQYAIDLAKKGGVSTAPNPMVGAVIVCNGEIIGEGFHEKHGEAHAEVNAVASVQNKELLKESTIYVTLEPCAHFGKTPPCADLIVKHHFKQVVIGTQDPFSKVNGAGIDRIRNAGIPVHVGVLETECLELNKRFFTFHTKKRPYITIKWAESLDGYIDNGTNENREIKWITGSEVKKLVHQQRAQESSILTGWKTIENDNPALTVREVEGKNPLRLVIDPHLKSSAESIVYNDSNPTLLFNLLKSGQKDNVEYIQLTEISVQSICAYLYEHLILSVYIEGGAYTIQSFIDQGYWDEVYRFIGNSELKNGTKAPILDTKSTREEKIGDDRFIHYINRTASKEE
jgi:diaminohydroxyphosphoribosylaminopyrimidine deaminase / 5-amino-6-(5-phosphoribosylamino)uracil reductase